MGTAHTIGFWQFFTCSHSLTVGYTMDTVHFQWLDNPVDVDKSVQLPQFTLTDIVLNDCSQNYTAGNVF